jgi:hypothetical protein
MAKATLVSNAVLNINLELTIGELRELLDAISGASGASDDILDDLFDDLSDIEQGAKE